MQFNWDIDKEKNNKKKHGITFSESCYVFSDNYSLNLFDEEHSDDEDRWITIGQGIENKILVVIHTYRKMNNKEIIRIISARKANNKEIQQYYQRRGKR
jgi:hypothetical protein